MRGRPRPLQLCALMPAARWDCVGRLLAGQGARGGQPAQAEALIVQALAALAGGRSAIAEAALDRARRSAPDDDRFLSAIYQKLGGEAARRPSW